MYHLIGSLKSKANQIEGHKGSVKKADIIEFLRELADDMTREHDNSHDECYSSETMNEYARECIDEETATLQRQLEHAHEEIKDLEQQMTKKHVYVRKYRSLDERSKFKVIAGGAL